MKCPLAEFNSFRTEWALKDVRDRRKEGCQQGKAGEVTIEQNVNSLVLGQKAGPRPYGEIYGIE